MPPAPSYQQVRELVVTKQSPHKAAASDTPAESPKAKCSSSKNSPQRGSRCSSNTSTPKCPDSTSAKKPSCPKESTMEDQVKSPQACSSCKHGHLPSPASGSTGRKLKDLCREDSSAVDTTLPVSSSMFDAFCSPMGSVSDVIELLPPSITSTPLGQAGLRHGCTTSSDSRHSSTSLFASSSFNLPSYPAVRLGSLTPLVPSITGSQHVLSTWPLNLFPSGPSTPQLTINQANNIFGLASDCQALSVRLAKDFQVLSGLEAMHCNSIQGTVHKTLTLGHSAWEATYVAILWNDIMEAECEATTCHLCSEADAMWKKMHEVMYNHQLEYDRQLAAFLKEVETTLINIRDQIWTTVHTLTENEGITFKDCLSLVLCVLHLLPQIPVDVSFQMQIVLTITYCPESSVYRRWHSKQGGVSPSVRSSEHLKP